MRFKNYFKTKFLIYSFLFVCFHCQAAGSDTLLSFKTVYGSGDSIKIMVEGSNLQFEGIENLVVGDEGWYKLTSNTVTIRGDLSTLRCLQCGITEINLSQAKTLKQLVCSGNYIKSIDASKCPELERLFCNSNELTYLNVDGCRQLVALFCFQNRLRQLSVNTNENLTTLSCTENKISEIDLSANKKIEDLYFGDNLLRSLNVSENVDLKTLWCNDNQLKAINLTNNENLRKLYCQRNEITELNLSNNKKVNKIYCFLNRIGEGKMQELMESLPVLPDYSKGSIYVVDASEEKEKNVCTKAHVAIGVSHNWKIYDYNQGIAKEYEGATTSINETLSDVQCFQLTNHGIVTTAPVGVSLYGTDGKFVFDGIVDGELLLGKGFYVGIIGKQKVKFGIK